MPGPVRRRAGGIFACVTFGVICTILGFQNVLIGASGCILAVLGAIAYLAPKMNVMAMMMIPMSMRALALLYAVVYSLTVIADKGIPFGGSWDYRIAPDGTGSRITITENGQVYNPIFRFVSRYVLGHTATLDKYLTALAARVGDTYVPSGKA